MRRNSAFLLCSTVTCVNALVSAGFSIATQVDHATAGIAAMYGIARSVPLALAALFFSHRRSYVGLAVLAPLMVLIQACDAVVGAISHDPTKVVGPAVLAIATFIAAVILFPHSKTNA